MTERTLSRRTALQGTAVVVVGGVAGYLSAHNSAAAKAKRGTTAANAYGPSTNSGGQLLAPVDKIPVGGGLILSSPAVVLVRSASGDVHAFSAVCTHQGCTVDKVTGGQIQCPCHGSRFDATTGAVVAGPAPSPLPVVPVVVQNGSVYTS